MKRVIVAVDESEYSLTAVRTAVEMVRKCNVEDLAFVHVVPLKPGQLGTDEYPDRPDLPERWGVFQKLLAMARASGVSARCVVLCGNTAEEILHLARREHADLIMLGSLGRSGIKEFLLGSVATRVTAHAPCSVMVVRPGFRLVNGTP